MKLRIPLLFALAAVCLLAEKRPLTHKDYDSWRHIQNQHLSNDGHFLAYALFPQEGDGELIVRNLITGKEWREPIGELPPPPPANFADPFPEGPPPTRGITLVFSRDSKTVAFSTFSPHAGVAKAKREKRKPEDMPKNGLVILDLTSGTPTRVPAVKSFQVPSKRDGFIVYLREPERAPAASATPAPDARPDPAGRPPARKKEYGSDLVVRNLGSKDERVYHDVIEYSLSKDGARLAYAVASQNEDANGVYTANPGDSAAPAALLSGKGKYTKLAFHDGDQGAKQDELAFLSDRDDAAAKQPRFKLYLWNQANPAAVELVSTETPGFQPDLLVSDTSPITFSKDGQRVFFGCIPKPAAAKDPDSTPAEDRVSVDLWHWKDDYIQPMQKVRARADRTRSFRAVYNLPEKKLVQLADKSMSEVTPNQDGRYSLGGDDREYRRMVEYDERYLDSYLVDSVTGSRKLLARKHLGRVTWSPGGKYALFFNGKDWITLSVPEGKTTNLTSNLGVKFWTEEHDSPGSPNSYGTAGWTKDGKYVLLYDHYDIWQVKPDGSLARNMTLGLGRKQQLMFRYARLDAEPVAQPAGRQGGEAPDRSGIDSAKPLLLRAENSETHDSGFFRAMVDETTPPQKLRMSAKNYSMPIKAKDADVLALTESSFNEVPDLQITDSSFKELRKVSDADPQKSNFLWGTAELIHFTNVDGLPLSGTLYKPENFDPKKKYPLLVYIYERLSQGLNAFIEPRPGHTINVTYYVSNGYLVLEPDIAYKIGFPGQSALNCVLPAVQSVVDRGFVDENAIGIQGHSWGGYQIAYMITQTNRFRAVAAGAPVANMTSAYDGIRWGPGIPRQFQYEKTQSRIGGTLWEYPMRYIENSPVFMADRVKTPLMMIHNDADDAVPWYQGIEYYLALRRLGKEVYLFTYNGEPHGLRRRPNQKDYTVRLQQYFDYYLKGAPKPDWMERGIPYLEKPGVAIQP
ncbi:MAG: alpha/beta hydrolase family protein [Bryobacteraceae bacterium]